MGERTVKIDDSIISDALAEALGQIVTGGAAVPRQGLVAFKSVGMALQDLALAMRYYELLAARPGLPSAPDLGQLRAPVRG